MTIFNTLTVEWFFVKAINLINRPRLWNNQKKRSSISTSHQNMNFLSAGSILFNPELKLAKSHVK